MLKSGGVHPHAKAASDSLKRMGFASSPGYGALLWRDGKLVARAWVSVAPSGKAVVTIDEKDAPSKPAGSAKQV